MVKMDPMTDDDFKSGGNYFSEGVHEVIITTATRGASTNTGTEFVEVAVEGHDGEKANTRLYLSDAAAPYTRRTLAGIAVHNADGDADKQRARDAFTKLTDTDDINREFLKKFEGDQAWITAEYDTNGQKTPSGNYYMRYQLFSYEPKPKKREVTIDDITAGGESVDLNDIRFE